MNHHSLKNALTMIDLLLKNLKFRMFLHVAADHASRAVGATVLMEEYMDASNFGVSSKLPLSSRIRSVRYSIL